MDTAYQAYAALKGANWGTLKEIDKSPLHYQHLLQNPRADTDAFAVGRAFHCLVLEPDDFPDRFVAWDLKTKTGRAKPRSGGDWQAFEGDNADKTVLLGSQMELVRAMAGAVTSDPVAMSYLDRRKDVEHAIQWKDEETGIACKGRLDFTASQTLCDLKSGKDIASWAMAKAAASYGYHSAMAFYLDGAQANGIEVENAALICVEKTAPFDVGILLMDDEVLFAGRLHYQGLLRELAICRREGKWPGQYYNVPKPLELPSWAPGMPSDEISFGG